MCTVSCHAYVLTVLAAAGRQISEPAELNVVLTSAELNEGYDPAFDEDDVYKLAMGDIADIGLYAEDFVDSDVGAYRRAAVCVCEDMLFFICCICLCLYGDVYM